MKETRLEESASIYSKQKVQTEKEKWSSMNKRERWEYFKEYYLLKLCVIVALSAFLIYLLIIILGPKNKLIFEAALINSNLEENKSEMLMTDIENLLKPKKREIIMVDDSYYMSGSGQDDMASEQKLSVCIFANELDIIIADQMNFEKYAKLGYFYDLAELLPTDKYSELTDRLVFAVTETRKEETAYGISIEGFKNFEKYDTQIPNPVIGVVSNSQNIKNAMKVLESFINE